MRRRVTGLRKSAADGSQLTTAGRFTAGTAARQRTAAWQAVRRVKPPRSTVFHADESRQRARLCSWPPVATPANQNATVQGQRDANHASTARGRRKNAARRANCGVAAGAHSRRGSSGQSTGRAPRHASSKAASAAASIAATSAAYGPYRAAAAASPAAAAAKISSAASPTG